MDGLYTQNIIPIYLLQEKLKSNFIYIQSALDKQDTSLADLKGNLQTHLNNYNQHTRSISQTLQSLAPMIQKRVEAKLAQGLNLMISNTVKQYFDQSSGGDKNNNKALEKQLDNKLARQVKELKGSLKVEIVNDTQTIIKSQISEIKKYINSRPVGASDNATINNTQAEEAQVHKDQDLIYRIRDSFDRVEELQKKMERVYAATQKLERQSYDYYVQSGDKIKLVNDELEGFRTLTVKKLETLKAETNKLKTASLLAPSQAKGNEKSDNQFRSQVAEWMDEVSQNIQDMLTKTEFSLLHLNPTNKRIEILEQELSVQKKELDNLTEILKFANQLSEGLEGFQTRLNSTFKSINKKMDEDRAESEQKFGQVHKKLQEVDSTSQLISSNATYLSSRLDSWIEETKKLQQLRTEIGSLAMRIAQQERINSFEEHMPGIHDLLDKPYIKPEPTASKTLVRNKNLNGDNPQIQEIGSKLSRLEKEYNQFVSNLGTKLEHNFLLYCKKTDIGELWKAINILENRVENIKHEQEQGLIKKQIVNLSIQKAPDPVKSAKDSQFVQYKYQESNSLKKLDLLKQGGFGQKANSSKNIKPFLQQEKPQKIQRVIRERYLSDTVKLPDILQEKLMMDSSRDNR